MDAPKYDRRKFLKMSGMLAAGPSGCLLSADQPYARHKVVTGAKFHA